MLILIIKIALIAYVFVQSIKPEEIFAWYGKLIDPLPEWLWKPLGGCFKCFTGQLCFWAYLVTYFHDYNLKDNLIDHLFFTSLGIFLSLIYNTIWNL